LIDFIIKLLESNSYTNLVVITNRLGKGIIYNRTSRHPSRDSS
jgi:hypothetical protein